MILLVCSVASLTLSTVDNENSLSAIKQKDFSDIELIKLESTPVYYGKVTYYGGQFHGKKTASGKIFDKNKFTAANLNLRLKFGTKVRITNINNNKSIVVIVNDKGSTKTKYMLDLSEAAFESIAAKKSGWVKAKVEVLN